MASPTAKHGNAVASVAAASVTPKARHGHGVASVTTTPTSPRLRIGRMAALLPPPQSPRARHPHPSVVVDLAPTSPRARRAHPPVAIELVKLWPVPPDWASPVVERLAWLTEVLTAHDQSEQRRGLRSRPLRSFSYSFLTGREDQPHVEAIVYALQDQLLEVPIWTDARRLTTAAAAGAGSLTVETTSMDYEDGGRVAVLAADYGVSAYGVYDTPWEVLTIDTVGDGVLTLAGGGPRRAWARGSFVAPVRAGRLASSLSWGRPTDHGVRGTVTLDLEDPGHETLPALVADTYQSRDVLPFRPDRGTDIQETMGRVMTRIQSVGGTLVVVPRSDRPVVSRSGQRFLFETRAEIQQLRAWYEARRGRLSGFYLPSFQTDLEIARPVDAADTWLVVKSVRGRSLYGAPWGQSPGTDPYQNAGRRDIELRATDTADPIRRRITSWATVGDGLEQIKLNSAVGVDISNYQAAMVSWLALSRHESDVAELRWLTADVVEAEIPMRSV